MTGFALDLLVLSGQWKVRLIVIEFLADGRCMTNQGPITDPDEDPCGNDPQPSITPLNILLVSRHFGSGPRRMTAQLRRQGVSCA